MSSGCVYPIFGSFGDLSPVGKCIEGVLQGVKTSESISITDVNEGLLYLNLFFFCLIIVDVA